MLESTWLALHYSIGACEIVYYVHPLRRSAQPAWREVLYHLRQSQAAAEPKAVAASAQPHVAVPIAPIPAPRLRRPAFNRYLRRPNPDDGGAADACDSGRRPAARKFPLGKAALTLAAPCQRYCADLALRLGPPRADRAIRRHVCDRLISARPMVSCEGKRLSVNTPLALADAMCCASATGDRQFRHADLP